MVALITKPFLPRAILISLGHRQKMNGTPSPLIIPLAPPAGPRVSSIIIAARIFFLVPHGASLGNVAMAVAPVLMLAALCIGVLALLAWLNARATIYTLTNRRVAMRIGVNSGSIRERKALDLASAVRKLATLPAERAQLARRGRIERGYFADLVLFDFARVKDETTFTEPRRKPTGIVRSIMAKARCRTASPLSLPSSRKMRYPSG